MGNPELRRAFAVGDAKRIWRRYGITSPQELVLEDVAWAMGLAVMEERLESADARLVRGRKKGIIRVNREIPWPGRKRFAVAHEIGHWCLHASISQLLACTNEDMRARYKDSEPEAEANWFAAELLMPEDRYAAAMKGTTPSPDVINGLADEFLVTRTAAAVRYVELCPSHTVFIMCKESSVKWWRCSKGLDGPLWIKSGQPVSPRTLAGKFFLGKAPEIEVQSIGAEDWADRYPDYASEFMEAIIPLGNTGAAITMLWLE